jgi:hypothetical protein
VTEQPEEPTGLTRRRLFQFVAAGGLAAALGGVGVGIQPTVMRTPTRALKCLSLRAFSILAALADRICPAGNGFPSASELNVAEAIDELMSWTHPGDVKDLETALLFFENALPGLLLDGRVRPFTACDVATQNAAIDEFRRSALGPRRQVFRATYGLIAGSYWANAGLGAKIGYPGQPDYGFRRKGPGVSRPPVGRRAVEPPGPLEPEPPIEPVADAPSAPEELK